MFSEQFSKQGADSRLLAGRWQLDGRWNRKRL
jgi:hypothetical protein